MSPEECYKRHYLSKSTPLNLALVRVMFNKDYFLKLGGFSTQYKSGDDYARLLMAAKHPVLIIQDGLVWWRKSPNSASFKLFNSYNGVWEPLALKYYFLNTTNLLSDSEEIMARKKLYSSYINILKSLLKKGKLYWTLKLIIDFKRVKQPGKI